MWPRTTEEKNRRRNTGFVCFMNRDDAEEALEACDETDPFNNGRLLTLRWGKSVKKIQRRNNTDTGLAAKPSATQNRQNNNHAEKFTKKACIDDDSSTGALPPTDAGVTTSNRKESLATSDDPTTHDGFGKQQQTPGMKSTPPEVPPYDPEMHASRAIRVETPKDLSRFHFISTTASYVAKDPELEQRFRDEEKGNPLFCFLDTFGSDDRNDKDRKEKLFYRWRVYSFCQGDTYSIWRTEPFLMFHGGGYWIPPPLDADAVEREKTNAAEKEYRQRQQKEDRANRELMTGRQFERRKRRGDFGANQSQLNPEELRRFDQLVRKQLSISRKTICEAMSFCFDNCVAAREVSGLLQEALLEDSDHVTNDTRIARLYLLSDILFNSQQPGVRNAFMYRTTIESMAVDIFENLGNIVRSKERSSGRITVNKLRKAVSAVLGAWTEWGVYNATFVDDLEASFEGREVKHDANTKVEKDLDLGDNEEKCEEQGIYEDAEDVVIDGPRGDWKEVSDEASPSKDKKKKTRVAINITAKQPSKDTNGKSILIGSSNCEPQNLMVDDRGGEKESDGSKASVNIDEELDGEELDGEELDGEEIDGEDLYGEVLDGEELDA